MFSRIHFTVDDGFQNFLAFASMLNSLRLNSNKKFTNWISTQILPEKNKLFDISLEPTMPNSVNGRVILILSKKTYSSLYSNFILIFCIVYEPNN